MYISITAFNLCFFSLLCFSINNPLYGQESEEISRLIAKRQANLDVNEVRKLEIELMETPELLEKAATACLELELLSKWLAVVERIEQDEQSTSRELACFLGFLAGKLDYELESDLLDTFANGLTRSPNSGGVFFDEEKANIRLLGSAYTLKKGNLTWRVIYSDNVDGGRLQVISSSQMIDAEMKIPKWKCVSSAGFSSRMVLPYYPFALCASRLREKIVVWQFEVDYINIIEYDAKTLMLQRALSLPTLPEISR
jgi:hypothetical protein